MARVQITYWGDIPVLVRAREGSDEVTVPLSQRFQDLVDVLAMQDGMSDSGEYLAQWRIGPEEERPGAAQAAASTVVAELEDRFAEFRARSVRPGGSPDPR